MKFHILIPPQMSEVKGLNEKFNAFQSLLIELQEKEIPAEIAGFINAKLDELNAISLSVVSNAANPSAGSAKEYKKLLAKIQDDIVKKLEKDLKIVTKNHYRNLWLAVGMASFGIPVGVAFGLSMGNMAFLGAGLPIGMCIGIVLGSYLDKKAEASGLQLNAELK